MIDSDLGFLGLLQRKIIEQLERKATAARGLDHQIGFQRHSGAVLDIVKDSLHPHFIARCDKLGHTGAHGNVDVRGLLNAAPGNGLEHRARHAEDVEAEITYGERIESGAFQPNILPGADLNGAGFREIALKSRKQGLQGL